MKMMRTYLSAYPFWYKLITLCLYPLAFIVVTTVFQMVEPALSAVASVWAVMNVYLALIEMETEFFSLGALYRKAEPFGKLVLTSDRGKGYFETFAKGDVLRRLLYCIILYELPLYLSALLRRMVVKEALPDTGEYLWGSRFLQHLLVALSLFAALQWSIYLTRHIQNRVLLTLAILFATALCTVLPLIFSIGEPKGVLALILAAVVLALGVGASAASVMTAKKAGRECYYDR